ncbi:MAG: M43 family zinc metalloprotease [Bacteroidia bacterium]|nr:M43 family zinc metalloprotease [Bacteroidia bacterium]
MMIATFIWAIWAQIPWCATPARAHPPSMGRALLEKAARQMQLTDTQLCRPSRFVIPVVFHVIYSSSRDRIPYERILGQMYTCFEDFRRIPESHSFTSAGVDTEIEFSLATKDENGAPTTGVVYWKYNDPPLNWSVPRFCVDQDYAMKQATGWDRSRYLNVWVVPTICVEDSPGNCNACDYIAGYAEFPIGSSGETYGVVLGANFFWGSSYGSTGRTLTHELGHCLELYHPFEDGCGTFDCLNSGDAICDTPPTSGPNYTIARQNTCNNDSPDLPDNPRNHMDYIEDRELAGFTEEQKLRAWMAIQSPSSIIPPLISPNIPQLTGTGPYGLVKAYFSTNQRTGCVGQPIQFLSHCMGMPHQYQWDFGGGIPNDPNSPCPIVTFPNPGIYTIQLIVQNLSGRRDTLRKVNYIAIYDTAYGLPYLESFEGPTFPPEHSSIENPDKKRTWDRFRSTSSPRGAYGLSNSCLRSVFFFYSHYGERDAWISPPIALPADTHQSVQLKFSWAYACLNYESNSSYELDYTDTLKVYVSTDCGHTWSVIWEKGGRDLSTHPMGCIEARGTANNSLFVPSNDLWKTDSLLLDAYRGETVRLRFEGISGWGNHLYLDDIRVDTLARRASGLGVAPSSNLRMYAHNGVLYLNTQKPMSNLEIRIYDMSAKCLWREQLATLLTGTHHINLPELSSRGVYLIHIQNDEVSKAILYAHP